MVLRLLNPPNPWARRGVKTCFLLIVAALVLYPSPRLFIRNLEHWRHLSELIRGHDPRLAPLAADARAEAARHGGGDRAVLHAVEQIVCTRWAYAYDWQTWGVANYLPTLDEAIEMRRCDCKGRAVLAGSILASLGYAARLVCDGSHVWVWTPKGEAMSPVRTASGRTVVEAGLAGNRVDVLALITPAAFFIDWPRRLAFAVGVFPPVRVALIMLALWLVCVPVAPRWWRALFGLSVIGLGTYVLASTGPRVEQTSAVLAWIGIMGVWAGVWMVVRFCRRLPSEPPPPSSQPA